MDDRKMYLMMWTARVVAIGKFCHSLSHWRGCVDGPDRGRKARAVTPSEGDIGKSDGPEAGAVDQSTAGTGQAIPRMEGWGTDSCVG